MLTRIMEVLSRKESLSMTQLADEVGFTLKELESALEQMERMGFIRREYLGQACGSGCDTNRCTGHCEGCGFLSSEVFTFWILTERGQTILGQNPCK